MTTTFTEGEKTMTVDATADSVHIYGNGADVGISEHVVSAGFEDTNVRIDRQHKQLILKLPPQDNGDGFSEGEMTFFLDPRNHCIVLRAWLPGEGIWRTTLELSPEN